MFKGLVTTSKFLEGTFVGLFLIPISQYFIMADETYNPTNRKLRGLVLIVNISKFPYEEAHDRKGSENDEKRLKKSFKKLGFDVKIKNDHPSKEDFLNYINIFKQKEKLKKIDVLFSFIMSHGRKSSNENPRYTGIEFPDRSTLSTDMILKEFETQNCPYLDTIPKIFIFQACRGTDRNFPMFVEDPDPSISKDINVPKSSNDDSFSRNPDELAMKDGVSHNISSKHGTAPRLSDTLVVHSTSPGTASIRDCNKGGDFIQVLCDILDQSSSEELEVRDVFNMVSRELKKSAEKSAREDGKSPFQIVHIENSGFYKKLYLNKKT